MVQLSEIMQVEVVGVDPQLTLRGLVELLAEESVSGAPVIAGGIVAGVISATDIMEFAESTPGVPTPRSGPANDAPWDTGEEEEQERAAPEFFSELWAPTAVDTLERIHKSDAPEWDILDQHVVEEVMTRSVISLPSTARVREAASIMVEHSVHRILVIDDGQLKGIVTTSDFVRAVAEGKLKS